MQKVLVIDDAVEITVAVEGALQTLGVHVDTAATMKEGLEKATNDLYSLVIIDILLPDGDGFDVLQNLRNLKQYKKTPTIFLTSKEDVASKISAFNLGADDYIVKPFHLLELRARVERQLKKALVESVDNDQVAVGPFVLEVGAQRLRIQGVKDYISLTPREFKILLLLTKNPNQIITRETILEKIWGKGVFVTDRTVDAHICYLRKKLDNHSTHIQSVPGEGYRFNPAAAKALV